MPTPRVSLFRGAGQVGPKLGGGASLRVPAMQDITENARYGGLTDTPKFSTSAGVYHAGYLSRPYARPAHHHYTLSEARVLVYATPSELSIWMGEPTPDNATKLLRVASIRVTEATQADVFDVQPNGKPKGDGLVEALRDATCAQAEQWAALGVDPVAGAGGLKKQVVSSSIDGASISTNGAALDDAKTKALDGLCEDAFQILRNAGLASSAVQS